MVQRWKKTTEVDGDKLVMTFPADIGSKNSAQVDFRGKSALGHRITHVEQDNTWLTREHDRDRLPDEWFDAVEDGLATLECKVV